MLDFLFGNKNVQKILLFLFVNGKCYGTQLHRSLRMPLTPIQKALLRLEKGGLIMSYLEGKTRVYQFNSAFPLLGELEQLLKRIYTLLPADQKKAYYVLKDYYHTKENGVNQSKSILEFWERLTRVKHLTFHAMSKSKREHGLQDDFGWDGKGKGEVTTIQEGNSLIFHEKGSWLGKKGEEVSFTKVFRWTLDRTTNLISLEYLRRGIHHPTFLFHLAISGKDSLISVESHLCGDDAYFGRITFDPYCIRLSWRVIGPKKNEEMEYQYI